MADSKKPNRLQNEKSPYLLQHAFNPVDWFPWGEEAFQKAKTEDKVVLLSIGYATCHWCHVMERESFEDERTAEILNRYFVSIKLDREERPDLDKIYMNALLATGQSGGWPLNFFLTPEKMPIYGGTYFPPENAFGRKSFKEVLMLVQNAWFTQKADILAAAKDLTEHLSYSHKKSEIDILPTEDIFHSTFKKYAEFYDNNFYGFKYNGTNKFPPLMALTYLMHYSVVFKNDFALEMAYNTAYAIKKGGIYDQIGGGIARYSTDHQWLVPHFEKMLYDNALFLSVNAQLAKISKDPYFLETAREIVSYIRRDLMLSEGGISSAEDADSEGEEGKFYVWSENEFDTAIQNQEIKMFWNVTKKGNFENQNILNETIEGINPFQNKISIDPHLKSLIEAAKITLLEKRNMRTRPTRDDKAITSWNCLYLSSLLDTYQVTNDQSYLKDALSIYNFLLQHVRREDGSLYRRYREGDSKFEGTLSDYTEFVFASLRLFQETENPEYFLYGIETLDYIEKNFITGFGAFYDSTVRNSDVLVRTIDAHDGVEPSGNSTMLQIYTLLSELGVNSENYNRKIREILSYFKEELTQSPTNHPRMLENFLRYSQNKIQVILIYKGKISTEVESIQRYLRSEFLPNVTWLILEEKIAKYLEQHITGLKNRNADTSHLIYVCQNFTCNLPVRTLTEMKNLISQSI